ncbi:histidine-rich glycoprotein-like [Vigna unguiculata]|uniref:histidine-rich glycoprotein-like n=1 Tax=Vigna unguiculata TaxID=3917 RepID=UPI0010163D44|nr:histidine-rich glycoprotein-like [Vigna unguiculata]
MAAAAANLAVGHHDSTAPYSRCQHHHRDGHQPSAPPCRHYQEPAAHRKSDHHHASVAFNHHRDAIPVHTQMQRTPPRSSFARRKQHRRINHGHCKPAPPPVIHERNGSNHCSLRLSPSSHLHQLTPMQLPPSSLHQLHGHHEFFFLAHNHGSSFQTSTATATHHRG